MRIPEPLLRERGVTLANIQVYAAIRARVGFEPSADNYLISWPSLSTIAADTGVHRTTAIRAIGWLDARDYLVRFRRPHRSSQYLIIPRREKFQESVSLRGRQAAIQELENWREEMADDSRAGQATKARERSVGGTGHRGRKSHPRYPQSAASDGESHPRDHVVAPTLPDQPQPCDRPSSGAAALNCVSKNWVSENCDPQNRGAADAARLACLVEITSNGNDKGQELPGEGKNISPPPPSPSGPRGLHKLLKCTLPSMTSDNLTAEEFEARRQQLSRAARALIPKESVK